ncbi:hypothetical protein [Fervidobacterium gondwanense]|uniref:hypothetical protein n=1 Tax=Fervidobacterium gondwanense TaxID=44754 RepID=UPI003C774A11
MQAIERASILSVLVFLREIEGESLTIRGLKTMQEKSLRARKESKCYSYKDLLWNERRGQVPAEPNLRDDKGFKPNQLIMVKGRQQTPKMA